MSLPTLTPVNFHEHTLLTFPNDGHPYVVMKPIVEAIGLDWDSQRQRIQRNPVLAASTVIMTVQIPGDDQRREITALPLKLLNGWLFGIDSNRVKPEIRETILMYQRECYDALYAYWHLGEAKNPRHADAASKRLVRKAINARAWALSQANYATYQALMLAAVPLDDPEAEAKVAQWTPPRMLPETAVDEAIALLQKVRCGTVITESQPQGLTLRAPR